MLFAQVSQRFDSGTIKEMNYLNSLCQKAFGSKIQDKS